MSMVVKNIKLIFICFKYNLLKAMDNRIAFIGQIFGMILNNSTMIIQWVVMFSLKENIGGYHFNDILLLWGISALTYGVSHVFFNNAFLLTDIIMRGKLDAYIVQPKNTLIYMSSSKMSVSAIGDILFGLATLVIIKATFVQWMLTIFFGITGGIILASFSIVINSLSFWLGNAGDLADALGGAIINSSTYPSTIFSEAVKYIFLTIIPVSFVVHIPLETVLDFNIIKIIFVVLFTIGISSLAFLIFKAGLKKYSSSNLMSARI